MGKNSFWLIIIPAIAFALFAKPAKADVIGEWTYSQSCSTSGSIEVIDDAIILTGPNDGGCAGQPHWVKIETTIPADVDTIDFTWEYQTNDGAWYDPPQYGVNGVYVQLTTLNNDTGTLSVPVQEGDIFTFRQYSTDSCCQPGYLTISNLSLWVSITSSTTTTTTSTTTVPETTVPVTSPTTTTVQETTTSSVENSTSTSSVPQTTSSVLLPTTTLPPEPSTSTEPPTTVQTTVPMVVVPPATTVAPVSVTTTTVPETTTTSTTTSTTVPESTTSTTVKPPVEISTTTSASPTTSVQTTVAPTTTLPMAEVLQDISTKSNEEVAALATSPQVLATISTQEAAQIFKALNVADLTEAETEQLIEAVQNAPEAIREEFEDKVDIFKSGLDDYVPTGSNIPVGERRTLVAITAGVTLAAAGTRIKR